MLRAPSILLRRSTRSITKAKTLNKVQFVDVRLFSDEKKEKSTIKETLNKLRGGDKSSDTNNATSSSTNNTSDNPTTNNNSFFVKLKEELVTTWKELLDSGKPKSVNKSLKVASPPNSSNKENDENDEANAYEGPAALMLVDEDMGTWEKLQKRLSEAPIISEIMKNAKKAMDSEGVKQTKEKISDIKEDAREAWETSQNPWVYRMSSVWDTVTAESEQAQVVRELQRLDPEFNLESFKYDLMEGLIPQIMEDFLQGNSKALKPWLGEAVYSRLSSEIRIRKQEGLIIDPHILSFDMSEFIQFQVENVEKGSPIILLHFMCQQINCVRNKDDEIVEGGEEEIRANSYIAALQREYNDEDGSLNWKIVDFTLAHSQPWI